MRNSDGGSGSDEAVGFNLNTEMLLCLIVLDDRIGEAMSDRAGVAFFRAFVVENRQTHEVSANQRFRYKDEDSWYRIKLKPEMQQLSRDEKVKYLADGILTVMRLGCEMMADAKAPKDILTCYYPPEPGDGKKTLDWLIEQDLVEVAKVIVDGRTVPTGKQADA